MKMFYKVNLLCAVLLLMLWTSCKVEKLEPVNEAVKDVSGTWSILKVTRNGADITNTYDFSKFKLVFEGNNYTLENKLPFLVSDNGTFNLDDNQYAFSISFNPAGGSAKTIPFNFPNVNGNRQLSVPFTIVGCSNTNYVYTLQRN
ncbi:DUF5004 domain-containing protein [Mucilaginibacter limnophilus]|uniref:DUF5004 domain-containing protein n=1 Tax=Mucilaginibacter limnophilus TaxID=1932778 RepID=A0A3S2V3R6_9SPHI|nr:DUF5004 domain-containing protein [Mucilaginibacter limnophilus]RVU02607.1 DUF5004 domain-containing protein [Mucilaginibacter limnophilus]